MCRVSVILKTERDADILEWLASQENRSEAFRAAARLAIAAEQRATTGIDEQRLRRVLREELARVATLSPASSTMTVDADPEAAALIDQMF